MYFYVHAMHIDIVGKRDALIAYVRLICPQWRWLLPRQVLARQTGEYINAIVQVDNFLCISMYM